MCALRVVTAAASSTPSKRKPKRSSGWSSRFSATSIRAFTPTATRAFASSSASDFSSAARTSSPIFRFSISNSSSPSSFIAFLSLMPCSAASTFEYAASCTLSRAATASAEVSTDHSWSSSSSSSPCSAKLPTARSFSSLAGTFVSSASSSSSSSGGTGAGRNRRGRTQQTTATRAEASSSEAPADGMPAHLMALLQQQQLGS
mmetsp:Transcript_25801/g.76967  ORF Transcript_25801/g.76967 Transcript_25801/m.76967 type:complete len:203 (-) Transcript_25801:159-767(-)